MVTCKKVGKDFALDILAVSAVHNILDCLFCSIIHRQVSRGWGDLRSPRPLLAFNSYHRQTVKKN